MPLAVIFVVVSAAGAGASTKGAGVGVGVGVRRNLSLVSAKKHAVTSASMCNGAVTLEHLASDPICSPF